MATMIPTDWRGGAASARSAPRPHETANGEIEADEHHERDQPLIALGRTVRDDKHAAVGRRSAFLRQEGRNFLIPEPRPTPGLGRRWLAQSDSGRYSSPPPRGRRRSWAGRHARGRRQGCRSRPGHAPNRNLAIAAAATSKPSCASVRLGADPICNLRKVGVRLLDFVAESIDEVFDRPTILFRQLVDFVNVTSSSNPQAMPAVRRLLVDCLRRRRSAPLCRGCS